MSQRSVSRANSSLPRWNASDRSFAAIGYYDSAYVKPVLLDGSTLYAVHAADGTLLDHFPSIELAFAILRQQDFQPLRVH